MVPPAARDIVDPEWKKDWQRQPADARINELIAFRSGIRGLGVSLDSGGCLPC
jgi:hypothetical protein